MAEFEGLNPVRWENLGVISMQVAFARLAALREDPSVESVTVASDPDHEVRVLASVDYAVAVNLRAVTPCEGNGAGALVPLLNAISTSHNMSIVCSGGEAGSRDSVIHTAVGGDGVVASVLEGLGENALVARNIALHTAYEQGGEAWLSAARAAAVQAAGTTVTGQLTPVNNFAAFQVPSAGPLKLTLNWQGPAFQPPGTTSATRIRLSVVGPSGARVLGSTGFSAGTMLDLNVNAVRDAIVFVDMQSDLNGPPILFALSSSDELRTMILTPSTLQTIRTSLLIWIPNPKPKEECDCVRLEVKRTAVAASAKSTNKGKSTAVSVKLAMGGFIQCEDTKDSHKCKGSIMVSPEVKDFTFAPDPIPLPVTEDCQGPCTGKKVAFNKQVTFNFTIDKGLPESGTVELTITPKCKGGAAGPPKPVSVFVDSTKPKDVDPDKTDSDGDGKTDTQEKKNGTDPNAWESK
ncbi:MAG: hypothetical protein FJW39_16460 [Acidobacteria bacterium]|nr:hypothetical protein [Acidobacteriota bacterium]